jgi:hypothetical protein
MAESETDYLRQCLRQNVCPTCQGPLTSKVGTGQFKDGVFCSLGCQAKWHDSAMRKRHQERTKKAEKKKDE